VDQQRAWVARSGPLSTWLLIHGRGTRSIRHAHRRWGPRLRRRPGGCPSPDVGKGEDDNGVNHRGIKGDTTGLAAGQGRVVSGIRSGRLRPRSGRRQRGARTRRRSEGSSVRQRSSSTASIRSCPGSEPGGGLPCLRHPGRVVGCAAVGRRRPRCDLGPRSRSGVGFKRMSCSESERDH
jgi:hypothetical protein